MSISLTSKYRIPGRPSVHIFDRPGCRTSLSKMCISLSSRCCDIFDVKVSHIFVDKDVDIFDDKVSHIFVDKDVSTRCAIFVDQVSTSGHQGVHIFVVMETGIKICISLSSRCRISLSPGVAYLCRQGIN